MPRRRFIAQCAQISRSVVAAVIAAVVVLSGVVALPGAAVAADSVSASGYHATIRRTSFGIPHVLADDLGGVAFGQAWAYAEDRFCDLADQAVKIRSERSRWFGPGQNNANLITDLAYQSLGLIDLARQQAARLSTEERQLLEGYVAGFNAFLAKVGVNHVPGWCAGQPWVGPVSAVDVLAYQRDIAIFASGEVLLAPIATAQPPGTAAGAASNPAAVADAMRRIAQQRTGQAAGGSNGWALGADRATSGKGMLVANPHFPWQGELRFWESQLTVPGKLNVYGAGIGGVPGVQIGFNDKVAWTHTIAAGSRLTFYSVDLVPGAPTTYLVDGRAEAMTAKPVTIRVDWGNGVPQPYTQTMWSTRYGPVLNLPGLGWTGSKAITYRDANIDNDRLMRQWLDIGRAADVPGIRDAIGRDQGMPWVNTIATDSKGNAWYADGSQTPALSRASIAEWLNDPVGLGLLNGSSSANTWVTRPGARTPGLVPFPEQPQLLRRDYVLNANDSHWFANENQLLTGFTPLQGFEGTPLSVRTRQNVKLINGAEPGTVDSYRRFDLPGLATAILSGANFTADELTSAVVTACRQRGTTPVDVDGTPVNLTTGCSALAAWDRRFDVGSTGAVLWRETIASVLDTSHNALNEAGPLFGTQFNPGDPAHTPRGAPANLMPLLTGLGRAMLRLHSFGLVPGVGLQSVQYTVKGAEKIPVPGANENVGIANVVNYSAAPGTTREPVIDGGVAISGTDMTSKGYVVNFGTSFVLTVGFTAQGPAARGLLTFSESGDPASPHFADQTRLFTRKQLRDCRFTEAAIAADSQLTVEVV